jgi:Flp pilus assembly protein TadD
MVRRCSAFLFLVLCAAARAQQDPEELLKEAIRLHQAGQAERAIPQYRAYLKLRPDSAMAHSNLGAALAGAGLYDDAIVEYRQAFEKTNDSRIRLNLALAYYKAGRISEAVR